MNIRGRGAKINTPNRFLAARQVAEHPEGIDEPWERHNKTFFLVERAKTVVNKVNSPDVGMALSLNPYQGCEHGCTYCYARNTHEYYGMSAGVDFESRIMVKQNAPELLEKFFDRHAESPGVISLSGNTDCYQPAERKYQITRRILETCLKYRNPVGIITKNSLILRDLDILKELSARNLLHVNISLTTLNESLRQKLEPRTASAKKRLETIRILSENQIPVRVMAAPMIPFLNTHELPVILKQARDAGALDAGYIFVRLNGAIGEIFTDWIRSEFPDKADRVLNHISSGHGGKLSDSRTGIRMKGEGVFAETLAAQFGQLKKRLFSDRTMPHYDLSLFRKPEKGQLTLF